jgi:hypothetical protein
MELGMKNKDVKFMFKGSGGRDGHMNLFLHFTLEPGLLVHACNSSYSGSTGRRIGSLGPAWTKVAAAPISKAKIQSKRVESVAEY